jgi:tRNA (adenine57-N1/adenine58-N1)-methyltransferase
MTPSQAETISEGEHILLYRDERKSWLVKATQKKFHTHKGIIDLSLSIDKRFGESINSSLGYTFWLFRPTINDFIMKGERPTQILYPKDIGFIIFKLDLCAGKKVFEVGTGSGALTTALANTVKPNGHIYSYELRKRFANVALKRLKSAKLDKYVSLRISDAFENIQERNLDAAVIDIGDPWKMIPKLTEIVKSNAPIVSFSPTFNQIEYTVEAMKDSGCLDIHTFELFLREMKVEKGATRPLSTMIVHTGYITCAKMAY